jgi:hypothetical protein
MSAEVQAHAQQVLVHSRHQAELLRLERPRDAAPTEVVPHGIPAVGPANGTREGGGPLVVADGIDGQSQKLLEAFAQLLATEAGAGARLLILGESEAEGDATMPVTAARLGIGDSVELSGQLEQAGYWRALQTADLAIRLRADADGGATPSGVCDLIAARVPTIVSDLGWQAELPVPVVLPIEADCSAGALAERIGSALGDAGLREEIRAAQDAYAAENSFARVAQRYAELLSL